MKKIIVLLLCFFCLSVAIAQKSTIRKIETFASKVNCYKDTYTLNIIVYFDDIPKSTYILVCETQSIQTTLIGKYTPIASPCHYQLKDVAADGKSYLLKAKTSEEDEWTYSIPFTTPKPCEKIIIKDTTCVGELYDNNGVNTIANKLGENHFYSVSNRQLIDFILLVKQKPACKIMKTIYVCENEMEYSILIDSLVGEPISYAIEFDKNNISNNISNTLIQNNKILISKLKTPLNLGIYPILFNLYGKEKGCSIQYPIKLCVGSSDLIYKKWDDIIFCNNKDGIFEKYQWYHNGKKIKDANNQYYYSPNKALSGSFLVQAIRFDGAEFFSCNLDIQDIPKSKDASIVSPVITKQGNSICVSLPKRSNSVQLYNIMGQLLYNKIVNQREIVIDTNQFSGMYILKITDLYSNKIWINKFVVQ